MLCSFLILRFRNSVKFGVTEIMCFFLGFGEIHGMMESVDERVYPIGLILVPVDRMGSVLLDVTSY